MNRSKLAVAVASFLIVGAAASAWAVASPAAPAPATPAAAAPFKVDAVHSAVLFKVKHLNVSWSYGRFNDIAGSFHLDAANPSASMVDITIKTESIDTANADRDKHLRSQDFFSSKEFPAISFKSESMRKTGERTYEASGTLSLRGQSKPMTVTIEDTGTGPGMRGGEVAGLLSTFTIKRSDFGMNYMVGPLGDEVTVTVSLEGGR